MNAEDWVRRHVKDRGGDFKFLGFEGGQTLVVGIGMTVWRATSYYGDELSAWELVADMMAPHFPEDDPSETGDY